MRRSRASIRMNPPRTSLLSAYGRSVTRVFSLGGGPSLPSAAAAGLMPQCSALYTPVCRRNPANPGSASLARRRISPARRWAQSCAKIFHDFLKSVARPQTAANDDPDACTSGSPTPPASVARRSCADVWCSSWARRLQTDRSNRTNARVPLPGPAHPG